MSHNVNPPCWRSPDVISPYGAAMLYWSGAPLCGCGKKWAHMFMFDYHCGILTRSFTFLHQKETLQTFSGRDASFFTYKDCLFARSRAKQGKSWTSEMMRDTLTLLRARKFLRSWKGWKPSAYISKCKNLLANQSRHFKSFFIHFHQLYCCWLFFHGIFTCAETLYLFLYLAFCLYTFVYFM